MKNKINFALLLIFILAGCNTNDSQEFNFDWNKSIVKDQLRAEALFVANFKFLFRALTDSALIQGTASEYESATVTRSGNTITFNYGSGQVCPDGFQRKGSFVLTAGDLITEPGASARLVFSDDFYFNSNHVEGTLSLVNISDSLAAYPKFSYQVSDGLIDLGYDYTYDIRYGCSFVMTWIEGGDTPLYTPDDVFSVNGSDLGKGREHDEFRVTIADSLWLQKGCNYLRGGTGDLTMPGFEANKGILNYMSKDTCIPYVRVIFKGTSESGDPVVSSEYKIRIEL